LHFTASASGRGEPYLSYQRRICRSTASRSPVLTRGGIRVPPTVTYLPCRVSGSTLTAVGRSQLLARRPGTHSRILSGIQRAAQTVLGIYLKRTCSRVTSASSALGALNDYALYKPTHSLTHSLTPSDATATARDRNVMRRRRRSESKEHVPRTTRAVGGRRQLIVTWRPASSAAARWLRRPRFHGRAARNDDTMTICSRELYIRPSRSVPTAAENAQQSPSAYTCHYLPPQNIGPCHSFYCLGHFKMSMMVMMMIHREVRPCFECG